MTLCNDINIWPLRPYCIVELSNIVAFGLLAYFAILLNIYIRCSSSKRSDDCYNYTKLTVGHDRRCCLSICLLVIHACEVVELVTGANTIFQAASACLSWIALQPFYHTIEVHRRPHYLLVTSFLYLICGITRGVLLYSLIDTIDFTYVAPNVALFSSALCYAMALNDLITLINEVKVIDCIEKKISNFHETYRHETANWYSRITFYWLVPLLRSGYRSPLELDDLGRIPTKESVTTQFIKFMDSYIKLKGSRIVPSLWLCYFHCYWKNFVLSGILKLFGDLVGLIAPLGVCIIVNYVENLNSEENFKKNENYITIKEFLNNGYVMSCIVFLSCLAQGSLSQASTHILNVEGIRLMSALKALIYTKMLKMNVSTTEDETLNESKVASSTNLLSDDVFNVMSCVWIGHYIWAIPLKIGIIMYLLHWNLGISAIIGSSCCIVFMTPLQFILGKKMSTNSKRAANWCDNRLKKLNEMLQSIKILKLCCWEMKFFERITIIRNQELKILDSDAMYWAIMNFLTHISSALISLITLGTYYYLEGSQLSPGRVFSALALFNQLTVPLFIFPVIVPIIISAIVSTRRLEEFMAASEITNVLPEDYNSLNNNNKQYNLASEILIYSFDDILDENDEEIVNKDLEKFRHTVNEESKSENVAFYREAGFSWNDYGKPTLWITNLNIPRGKLTVIIGRVGSGKSSLICSMLGEMHCVAGLLKWEKGITVAYVSQQPWLFNGTVRDNIIFGMPFNQKRFMRVISATSLQQDISLFPNKDLMDVGNKGINLSGGQKQRIAIARAMYSKANLILMDDPLSALDNKVAQDVFENCIYKLVHKYNKTVVLVTHSLYLLPYAHQVVALDNGRIKACGRLDDLSSIDGLLDEIRMNTNRKEKTARERWKLVKMVSQVGNCMKTQTLLKEKQIFIPLKKRNNLRLEYYWANDLPMLSETEDECDQIPLNRVYSLPRNKQVSRTISLQTASQHSGTSNITRQSSSPTLNQTTRTKLCKIDFNSTGRNIWKLLKLSTNSFSSRTDIADERELKENSLLNKLLQPPTIKYFTPAVTKGEYSKQRMSSTCSECSEEFNDVDADEIDWNDSNSYDDRQYGKIPLYVYIAYIQSCGLLLALLYLFLAIAWQTIKVYSDFWLSEWTNNSATSKKQDGLYYLSVYALLSVITVFICLLCNVFGQYSGARGRKVLHEKLLKTTLSLPLSLLLNCPLGKVLSRFSTDISIIDKKLSVSIQRLVHFILLCFSSLVVNSIVTPWFLLIAFPICSLYYLIQKFYRRSSRELHRLDSLTRTPELSHLMETVTGLEVIRAFKQQRRFTSNMFNKIDIHTNTFLILNSTNRWLGIALDYLGAVIVLLATLVAILCSYLLPNIVTPAMVGLAVNYTLLVPIYLNWVVKFISDVEMYTTAVQRLQEFIKLPLEDYRTQGIVPRGWPLRGEIRFENVTIKYVSNSGTAISNLTLRIPSGQKIGICGRTGSGKSSLVMSLLGMSPITDGSVLIDGVDIATIPLKTLRSKVSVIPQDVIMFSGTIRDNLDLQRKFTDSKIWEALEISQMKETVIRQLGGLYGVVREGGVNLSCGQRQLLCLARAVLNNAAILLMDEATSSLDVTTEKTFLKAAKKAFINKTVITVAHRLDTLSVCDRVLVIEAGKIIEDGKPNDIIGKSEATSSKYS